MNDDEDRDVIEDMIDDMPNWVSILIIVVVVGTLIAFGIYAWRTY